MAQSEPGPREGSAEDGLALLAEELTFPGIPELLFYPDLILLSCEGFGKCPVAFRLPLISVVTRTWQMAMELRWHSIARTFMSLLWKWMIQILKSWTFKIF